MYRTRILTGLLAASILCAYSQEPVTISDSSKAIAAVAVDQATGADTTHPPADFVDVDKEPVVITKKEPVYPALALKAGMEGRVWVKIWVDKSGLPHQAIILKSDQEIFNAPALDAAMQFRFTPASLKGNPVDVWVSVPFRFKLAEKKEPQKAPPDTVYGKVPRPIIDFLRQVLEGSAPDTARVSALLTAKAEAIAGGYLKPLRQAIEEQRQGKESIEQAGRRVEFITYGMADDGRSGYIVARTSKAGKNQSPHYHTIVIQQTAQGEWKIAHWHAWRGSR
jgi:TonB family protein